MHICVLGIKSSLQAKLTFFIKFMNAHLDWILEKTLNSKLEISFVSKIETFHMRCVGSPSKCRFASK